MAEAGYRLAWVDPASQLGLWVAPGPRQDEMAEEGRLVDPAAGGEPRSRQGAAGSLGPHGPRSLRHRRATGGRHRRHRREHRPARLQREGPPAPGDRPHPGGHGRLGVLLRDHRHRRRLRRRLGRGPARRSRASGSSSSSPTGARARPASTAPGRRGAASSCGPTSTCPTPTTSSPSWCGRWRATTRWSGPGPPRRAPTRCSGCRPRPSSGGWRLPGADPDPRPQLGDAGLPARRGPAVRQPAPARVQLRHHHHPHLPGPRLHREVLAHHLLGAGRRRRSSTGRRTPGGTCSRSSG